MPDALPPYPAYKDSGVPWLGRIPAHWVVRRLKGICRFAYGDSLAEDMREPGSVPMHGSNGRVGYHSGANTEAPCVVIGRKGSFGKIHFSAEPVFAIDTTFFVDGRFTSTDVRWLHYLLGWLRLDEVSRDSAVPGLNRDDAYRQPALLPPLPEQHAITRYLNYMDRRIRRYIRAKQKLIALLEEQKQAVIHQAVTGQIDVRTGRPYPAYKPSGVEWLGDVPEHWDTRPAKYFFREVDERSLTGKEALLSVSHITGVTPRSQKNITMFMAASYVDHKRCQPGDLVINTMWAWMGALGIAMQTGLVSPSYGVYRPLHSSILLPEYADRVLRTKPYVDEYICRSTGIRSSRLRLYPEQFLRIHIVCPSVNEQRSILDHITDETNSLNMAIDRTQRENALLREYRTRFIADVVTGQVDVRAAAARLPGDFEEIDTLNEVEELAEDEEGEEQMDEDEEVDG